MMPNATEFDLIPLNFKGYDTYWFTLTVCQVAGPEAQDVKEYLSQTQDTQQDIKVTAVNYIWISH